MNALILTVIGIQLFFHPSEPGAFGFSSRIIKNSTFYVSVEGSDSSSGSKNAPWKSPGYACKQLSPGDTLIIFKIR